ncbi:lysine-specific demethylase JMJ25 isoform X1, partial [Tanacetum coccineum]
MTRIVDEILGMRLSLGADMVPKRFVLTAVNGEIDGAVMYWVSEMSDLTILPSIKANVKASTKKCHWCGMCSYRVLIKCLTCKKRFFCEDCIRERNQDKEDVQKECPVCCGTCSCKVCMKGKPKEDRTKDLVVYRGEEKFEKTEQLLYMIHLLLPILEQINHEKDTEMDIESNIQEKDQSELQIQDATDSTKPR